MSEFYGRTEGQAATQATRTGSRSSGIASTVETWTSIVRTGMRPSDYTASGHVSEIQVVGKYGGHVLSFYMDTDTLCQVTDDYRVRQAMARVRKEVDRLNVAVADVAKRRAAR